MGSVSKRKPGQYRCPFLKTLAPTSSHDNELCDTSVEGLGRFVGSGRDVQIKFSFLRQTSQVTAERTPS